MHLYEHVEPLQLGWPVLLLHVLPQPPQLDVEFSGVSQPFVSGAVVSQLAHPPWQPAYVHDEPEQPAPVLVFVSHALPHAPQFVGVVICVSHPFVLGGVALQSL